MQIKISEIPLKNIMVTSGMLSGYMLLVSFLLPFHFIADILGTLWKWMLGVMLCSGALFYFWFYRENRAVVLFENIEKFEFKDLFLLLLPMTPIVQYIIFNYNSLSVVDVFSVISFFLILLIVFACLIPWVLSVVGSRRILMHVAVYCLFILFYLPSFIKMIGNLKGSYIQILILSIISTLFIKSGSVPRQIFATIIVAYFLMNTVTSVLSADVFSKSLPSENAFVLSAMENKEIKRKNDIILIVYESYANYETMLQYGFDNKEQLLFLENHGFHVYNGSYTLAVTTVHSMSKVFNIEPKGSDKKIVAGSGSAHKILRKQGYQLHGIFQHDYFFRGLYPNEIELDFFFPDFYGGASLFIKAILTGYFDHPFSFRGVGYDAYLKKKHCILKENGATPRFLYAHSVKPGHSPDRGINPGEEKKVLSFYVERIQVANDEMRQDVNLLLKHNPESIVIIAGDHGPFLTKRGLCLHQGLTQYHAEDFDRLDIQDRFGTFLAIRWPEKEYAQAYDIKILQDIFPAVFSYLFDDDTLFERIRISDRTTVTNHRTLDVYVDDGMIIGGKDDGKPLFEGIQ